MAPFLGDMLVFVGCTGCFVLFFFCIFPVSQFPSFQGGIESDESDEVDLNMSKAMAFFGETVCVTTRVSG